MTDRDIMRLALDALTAYDGTNGASQRKRVLAALRERLAQPEQEPVAWMTPDGEGFRIRFSPPVNDVPLGWDALYTAPPQRKPLTDEKIWELAATCLDSVAGRMQFARAIEAAHGIKE